MKKLSNVILIICMILILSEGVNATAEYYSNDMTPPFGRIEVTEVIKVEGSTDEMAVTVQIYAKDDMAKDSEIKYYLSVSEIANTSEITEWKGYTTNKTDSIKVKSGSKIYVVFKDKNGNTSHINDGKSLSQTIVYDIGDGVNAPSGANNERIPGMPFVVTSQKPKKEGYFFLGWSMDEGANTASFKAGDIIPADMELGSSDTVTLYAVYTNDETKLPEVSQVVQVGDYVNYPVFYDNVSSDSSLTNYEGWRVISIEEDGTVNLVSAGVPLTYYHTEIPDESITKMVDNFVFTGFTVEEDYTYRKTGFNPYDTLTNIFSNKYTLLKENGVPKVRALQSEDVLSVTGASSLSVGDDLSAVRYHNLFDIGESYWLASDYTGDDISLLVIDGNGVVANYSNTEYGVRPIVSLKPGVIVTGTDTSGAWNIKIVTFKITFDANGGTGQMEDIYVDENAEFILPENEFVAPEGQEFAGWSVNGGEAQIAGTQVTAIGDMMIKAIWQKKTSLADSIKIGDYVSYTGNGTYLVDAKVTGVTDIIASEEGVTEQDGKTLNPESTTWRVWDIKEDGSILIIPTIPVNEIYLYDLTGFLNSIDVIEDICDIYVNSDLGVTIDDVQSLKIEDLEAKSNCLTLGMNSYSTYGTKPYTYTSGTFYIEDDGLTINKNGRIASSSNKISLTKTTYAASNPTWNSLQNDNFVSDTYGTLLGTTLSWMASPRIDPVSDNNLYYSVFAGRSERIGMSILHYFNGGANCYGYGVRPLVSLDSTLDIKSGDGKTSSSAWELTNSATKYMIVFESNGGTGTMNSLSAVDGYTYKLPHCEYTAPSEMMFDKWSINGVEYGEEELVTITENTTVTATWKKIVETSSEIQIGDYVNYTPYTASNTYTTTTDGTSVLYTGYSQQTLTRTENTIWRVIKIDTVNNEILITPTDAVNTDNKLYLQGVPGYFNHKNILDDVSDKLYGNTMLGLTARSMTSEDLDYTISDETTGNYAYYPNGTTDISNVNYNDIIYKGVAHRSPASYTTYNDYTFWEYDKAENIKKIVINGKTYEYGYPTTSSPVLVSKKRLIYTTGINTIKARSLIGQSYSWLASSCISLTEEYKYTSFYVHRVNLAGMYNGSSLLSSYGYESYGANGIRPVVTLGDSINLSRAGTKVDGDTVYKVWDISG